jgi:hypothetical protein
LNTLGTTRVVEPSLTRNFGILYVDQTLTCCTCKLLDHGEDHDIIILTVRKSCSVTDRFGRIFKRALTSKVQFHGLERDDLLSVINCRSAGTRQSPLGRGTT